MVINYLLYMECLLLLYMFNVFFMCTQIYVWKFSTLYTSGSQSGGQGMMA